MPQVVLASSNQGKLREFQERLGPLGWELLSLAGFGIDLPPEDGSTYEQNALIKAVHTAQKSGLPALADDSGVEVDALNGAPGLYSARYGNKSSDLERNQFLLENLRDVPAPRHAKFVAVVALALPNGTQHTFRGECAGEILFGPRGAEGFGYDPLFWIPSLQRTFAELSLPEKRAISHRGLALEHLLLAVRSGSVALE